MTFHRSESYQLMTADERIEADANKSDIDRECAESVYGFCAWCNSWFDRATGRSVLRDEKPESHGICRACSEKILNESKRVLK